VVALLSLIIPFDSALAKYVVSVGQTQLPGRYCKGPQTRGDGMGRKELIKYINYIGVVASKNLY